MTPILRSNVIKFTFWLLLIANNLVTGISNDILKFNNTSFAFFSSLSSSESFQERPSHAAQTSSKQLLALSAEEVENTSSIRKPSTTLEHQQHINTNQQYVKPNLIFQKDNLNTYNPNHSNESEHHNYNNLHNHHHQHHHNHHHKYNSYNQHYDMKHNHYWNNKNQNDENILHQQPEPQQRQQIGQVQVPFDPLWSKSKHQTLSYSQYSKNKQINEQQIQPQKKQQQHEFISDKINIATTSTNLNNEGEYFNIAATKIFNTKLLLSPLSTSLPSSSSSSSVIFISTSPHAFGTYSQKSSAITESSKTGKRAAATKKISKVKSTSSSTYLSASTSSHEKNNAGINESFEDDFIEANPDKNLKFSIEDGRLYQQHEEEPESEQLESKPSETSRSSLETQIVEKNFNYHKVYNDPQQSHGTAMNHHRQHRQQSPKSKKNVADKSNTPQLKTNEYPNQNKDNEDNENPDELVPNQNFYLNKHQLSSSRDQQNHNCQQHRHRQSIENSHRNYKKRHRHERRHRKHNTLIKAAKRRPHSHRMRTKQRIHSSDLHLEVNNNQQLMHIPNKNKNNNQQNHQHHHHHHHQASIFNENRKTEEYTIRSHSKTDESAERRREQSIEKQSKQMKYFNQYDDTDSNQNGESNKNNLHHYSNDYYMDDDENVDTNDNYPYDPSTKNRSQINNVVSDSHGRSYDSIRNKPSSNIEISDGAIYIDNIYDIQPPIQGQQIKLYESAMENFQHAIMRNSTRLSADSKYASSSSLPYDNEAKFLPNLMLKSHLMTTESAPFANELQRIKSMVFRSLPDTIEYQEHFTIHWPVKREAIVEGDLILGGLMMVHSREDSNTCGPIMPQGGIQALEAMLYTIDRINEAKFLPNIRLGAHILDDCDKDSYGLEMAVDFIKGSISNIDDAEYHCNKTQVRKVISGVVGAASSVTSIQVANLLRLFRIPQVSFFSTSPELSNKQRFEYFSRTIPSDRYQVKAMVEIVKRMNWSYISIIYEESNYGIKAYEELEELLAENSICIAVKEKLVKDSGVAGEKAYDSIVLKLLTKPRARGAIIFGSDQEVREVMRAVRRNNATGAFSWIGSDGWSARNLVSDGYEPEVEGTLSVQPQANPVKGFEAYFLNLTVENNLRNPWFVEFWEDHFMCRYPNSMPTPYNKYYNRTCSTKEILTRNNTDFEDQLQFVSDAVMAFAYALRDMHRDLCGGKPTLCDAMKPTKGADLLKYLRKVEFEGLSGDEFRFDVNGDGPARYNIIHFKQVETGKYRWVKVGEYYEGELRLNMTEVQFKLLDQKPPESVCSLPCEKGQAKKYVEGESCCWHCFNCSLYQIRHPLDETQCVTCDKGTLPNRGKERCQVIPEVYLRPESAWAIGAMAFSSTGILITLFVVGVFVKHNDTPVVRASGRELSYILLAGILMCYMVTFALVLRPTNVVCGLQRFGAGFCFTVVYAALLTKTNRIARIFKAGKSSAKRPSFISPKSQLVICACLTFVQILINAVWMLISPSHAIYHYPTREDNLLVCDSYIDASYMIAFSYPILLIVVCTVYAVLTRKIPEAFNESKHIGFTMYTTCVIWLAFVPLYFGTGNHVSLRITSMSVTISLSASVTVACLFSPKLYIILVHPERNVRQSMMPARFSNINRGTGTGPSSVMAAAMVTAATCNQEEKLHKHISPSNTETNGKIKFCEIATQTVNISSIFTNIDSTALAHYNANMPYVDQIVPTSLENNCQNISNNNKINSATKIASPPLSSKKIEDVYQQQQQSHRKTINLTAGLNEKSSELKNNVIDTSL